MISRSTPSILFVCLLTGAAVFAFLLVDEGKEAAAFSRAPLVQHGPIHIFKNFTEKASQEGWAGTGIEGDPYVIEGLEIDASGNAWGIFISGTEEHFEIRGCVIKNADTESSPQYKGNNIYMISVSNGTLIGNSIFDSNYTSVSIRFSRNLSIISNSIDGSVNSGGLHLWNSNNILVKDNNISDNHETGFSTSGCGRITLINNTIGSNGNTGLHLTNTGYSKFSGNSVQGRIGHAIVISGNSPENQLYSNSLIDGGLYFYLDDGTMASQTITENNTVDGAPIRFYANKDMSSMSTPSDTGQILLANVTGLSISGIDFDKGSIGMQVLNSKEISVTACTFMGLYIGAMFVDSSSCDISNNIIMDMGSIGINLEECSDLTLHSNDISDATIGLYQSGVNQGIEVMKNTIRNCNEGISLHPSLFAQVGGSNNTFSYNDISGGTKGFYVIFEEMSIISNNSIKDMGTELLFGAGIELFNTKNMTVSSNMLMNSSVGIDVNGRYWGGSWHNTIKENRVEEARDVGIYVNRSMGGDYTSNLVFRSASFGMKFENSYSNYVHLNSFIKNNGSTDDYSPSHIQAKDDSTLNSWQMDGKGNFWSDWKEPDNDGNGIVDEAYLIFGDENFDTRPLTGSPILFLSEPLDLVAEPGDETISLSWSPPLTNLDDWIESYSIFKREGDGAGSEAFTVNGTDMNLIDDSVENNIEYHYWIAAVNKFGMGTYSEEVSATPDGTPPILEILYPMDGSVTNMTSLPFIWNGTDDVAFDHFEIRIDESEWIRQANNMSANITHISEGEHTFYLAGFDTVGNRNEINITFIVDFTAPVVWFTMFPDGIPLSFRNTTLEVDWNGTDDIGVERYEIRIDDGEFIDANQSFSYVLTDLDEGDHTVQIRVWDLAGNSNITSISFEIDLTAPTIHIIWPVDELNTLDRNITATWFTIENSQYPYVHSVKIDGGEWIELGQTAEYEISNLSVGIHTFTIRAVDSAGNIGENVSVFEVFEDEIPPVIVTINGRVVDKDGDPLSGVKITSDDGHETSTDSNGDFVIQVEKGPRAFQFEKKGYKDWTKNFDATDNMTIPGEEIELEEKEDEDRFLGLRRSCYFCCGAPMVILLALILIGLMVKITKKRDKDQYHYEE